MEAVIIAVGGTLLSAWFLYDWKKTGGREAAEFMKVKPGIFSKGDAKTKNGLKMLALAGPIVGVLRATTGRAEQ